MATSVELYGIEFIFTDFSDGGYREDVEIDGLKYPRWAALHVAAAKDFGRALTGSSVTSLAIGSGSKTFTLETPLAFGVGAFVLLASNSDPLGKWMLIQLSAVNTITGECTGTVREYLGAGTLTDWAVSLSSVKTGNVKYLNGNFASVSDATFTVTYINPYAGTLTESEVKLSAGTCTVEVQKNGVAVSGSTHSASTSLSTISRSTAVAAGDTITLVVTSNSGGANLSYNLTIEQ